MILKILLTLSQSLLALILSLSVEAAEKNAQFEKIRPALFQVKTITPGQEEKRSYGTGFVVGKNGLLATNFHVVAEHIWKPSKYKIVIDIQGQNIGAKVVAIDIINDLAIIQVEQKFNSVLKLSPSAIKQGQSAYSYGLPEDLDWTVVQGVYNGVLEQGPYQLIHLSSPLNPGMSGGPTTNTAGDVIGINSSGRLRSQEISFAVPSIYLLDLLKNLKDGKPFEPIKKIEIQSQILQDKMTKILIKGFQNKKNFHDIDIPKFDKSLRCWGDSSGSRNENSLILNNTDICQIENSLFIDGERSFGTLKIEFRLDENLKLNPLAWGHYKAQTFGKTESFVRYFVKDSAINFLKEKCLRRRVIQTYSPEPAILGTCLQKITPFHDLFDAYIFYQIPLVSNSKSLTAEIMLSGFSEKNIQKITEALLKYSFLKKGSE